MKDDPWKRWARLIQEAIRREHPWCKMCSLGVFPGHGHVAKDGTKEEALIRWL